MILIFVLNIIGFETLPNLVSEYFYSERMGATDKHMVCRGKPYVLQFRTHPVGPSMYLNSSMVIGDGRGEGGHSFKVWTMGTTN